MIPHGVLPLPNQPTKPVPAIFPSPCSADYSELWPLLSIFQLIPAVPGVDMANHDSVSPNAQVAIQHSPGAVQGWDAVDEVCDPDTLPPPQPSTFNLVAGAQTIR